MADAVIEAAFSYKGKEDFERVITFLPDYLKDFTRFAYQKSG